MATLSSRIPLPECADAPGSDQTKAFSLVPLLQFAIHENAITY